MSKETEYVLELTPPAPENPPALSAHLIKLIKEPNIIKCFLLS
jgi:hypothetical protein